MTLGLFFFAFERLTVLDPGNYMEMDVFNLFFEVFQSEACYPIFQFDHAVTTNG